MPPTGGIWCGKAAFIRRWQSHRGQTPPCGGVVMCMIFNTLKNNIFLK
jgi:hypothetical protein